MADQHDRFIDTYADFAIDAAAATGIAAEVILGQTALETGWGRSVAQGNMFGIKGAGQVVTTHEDYGRGLQKTKESFRTYDTPLESFKDHSRLMGRDRYSGVREGLTVADQVAAMGKSGYATDKNYASKLSSIVDRIQDHRTFQDKVVNAAAGLTETATPNFDGVPFNENRFDDNSFQIDPVNFGTVDNLGPLPDLTSYENINPVSFNQSMGPPAGNFDWGGLALNDFNTDPLQAGFSLPDQAVPNFDDVSVGSYPEITAGTAFDPMTNISPVDAAPMNVDDVPVGSYPEITASAYDPASWSTDVTPAKPDFSDVATPQVSGFHAGMDGFASDIPTSLTSMSTPDLEAASLQNEMDMGKVNQTAVTGWGATPTGLQDQQADLGINPTVPGAVGFGAFAPTPSAPAPATAARSAPAPASSYTSRASAPRESAAPQDQYGGFGATLSPAGYADQVGTTFGTGKSQGNFMDAMANPTAATNYDSLPAAPAASFSNGFGLGNFGLGGMFGKSSPPDAGFMDAMASPQHAAGYSPGIMDGWTGNAIRGAAMGAMGGPFGALMGGAMGALNIDGRIGAAFSNQFGGFDDFAGFHGFDGYDASTMGYGEGFNARGERSPTGPDNSGNATVGDGSYGESSGVNDNNPQGIL